MNNLAVLSSSGSIIKPTRDQIINVQANFCNLFDSEGIPIFDGFIDWLILNNINKAEDWISILKANKTTHITLDLSGDYAEPLSWSPTGRYPIPGMDWTNNISGFIQIIEWVMDKGFIPIIKLAMDGQGAGPGYNDPVGWTYGWQWGMNNLPQILLQLKDFHDSCLWSTGWDGCFPTWSRTQTIQALQMLRNVLGNDACIDTEFNGPGSVGYCHMGNGAADWTPDALGILDNFSIEAAYPINITGCQQTAARMLGPDSKNIDPSNAGPYYLAQMDMIKKINVCWFEDIAYEAFRKQVTEQDAIDACRIAQNYGFTSFGNGQP